MGSRVKVTHIPSGVRAVLKSDGVAGMLGQQAERAAARCNALCDPALRRGGARYEASVKQMGFTAGGVVRPAGAKDGLLARIDNARNNTMKKGCGL